MERVIRGYVRTIERTPPPRVELVSSTLRCEVELGGVPAPATA